MTWRKNADGVAKHKQQVIQKDWFKENGYKQNCYPDDFYESINNELTPPRRAYWALAIDGDGTIFSKKHSLRVKIELTDREPIQFLADLYGASISRVQYSNRIWKDNYIITLFGKRCLHFLRLICPYMTEKRKHATQLINIFDPNYHPPKIPMNFRKYPELITTHMGMVAGLFETEGSVGIKVATTKYKSKTKGTRFYNSFNQWIHFTNTNLYPLRKIKRILESWPFIFKPKIHKDSHRLLKKNGELQKSKYKLIIPRAQHLLFMAMFAPFMLMQRKKNYLDKLKIRKQITEICKK